MPSGSGARSPRSAPSITTSSGRTKARRRGMAPTCSWPPAPASSPIARTTSWCGSGRGPFRGPPRPGKLADCENNVMVWLGSGSLPETLPTTLTGKPCFTLMTGAAGLAYWNNAVAQWQANHPNALTDIGPPIVSLFSPGVTGSTTLAATVNLVATAVDDRGVVGVQFQMNGVNIGSEVTAESSPTKYQLSWDSHGLTNGTYTLTAIARDAAGNTTTSAGVAVTISN